MDDNLLAFFEPFSDTNIIWNHVVWDYEHGVTLWLRRLFLKISGYDCDWAAIDKRIEGCEKMELLLKGCDKEKYKKIVEDVNIKCNWNNIVKEFCSPYGECKYECPKIRSLHVSENLHRFDIPCQQEIFSDYDAYKKKNEK